MKYIIAITLLLLSGETALLAQTKQDNISFTYAEFRVGYGTNTFGSGLKEKYNAGNFSSSGGGLPHCLPIANSKK
jgi:hypothetical protein